LSYFVPAKSSLATLVAIVLSLCCLTAGAIGLVFELTRQPIGRQVSDLGTLERASRWHTWTADRLFPRVHGTGARLYAVRLAVAPESDCAGALNPVAQAIVSEPGCQRVLRATYSDRNGTLLATVAIVVMRDEQAAARVARAGQAGPRPSAFPGTLAARFGDAQAQHHAMERQGRYVTMATAGYPDGRPTLDHPAETAFAFAGRLVSDTLLPLTAVSDPCRAVEVVSC
jgi:hypothetical protein